MKTIHPGHLEHRFCIFGCQILCITDLAIMPLIASLDIVVKDLLLGSHTCQPLLGVSGRLSLWISNSRDLNQHPQTRHLAIPLVTMELLSSRRRYRLYLTRSLWRIALATNVWEALCSLHGPPKHKYTSAHILIAHC